MVNTIEIQKRKFKTIIVDKRQLEFEICYDENNIVTKIIYLEDDMSFDVESFRLFSMFKDINIDDMNENLLRLIYEFDTAYLNVFWHIAEARANRQYAKDHNLEIS